MIVEIAAMNINTGGFAGGDHGDVSRADAQDLDRLGGAAVRLGGRSGGRLTHRSYTTPRGTTCHGIFVINLGQRMMALWRLRRTLLETQYILGQPTTLRMKVPIKRLPPPSLPLPHWQQDHANSIDIDA